MTDPALYRPRATLSATLTSLGGELSPVARVAAWHAVARSHIELGDSAAAGEALRTALAMAAREGLDLAELRLTMAWVHFDTGDLDACLGLLDLVGDDPRALCLRGLACGAVGDYARAEPLLSTAVERLAEPRWLANALCTRGIIRSYLLMLPEAEADFVAAQRLYTSIGAGERAASCLHNRGFVAFRAGDLPLALRLFDDAERAGMRSDERGETLVDRAGALLAGGLVTEAAAVLRRAARLLGDAGRGTTFAEATLSLARCALHGGAPQTAIRAAVDAAAMFERQGRPAWTAAARSIELRARFAVGPSVDLVPTARTVAAQCKRSGWPVEAAELVLAAAEHASAAVRTRLLTAVAAGRTGPTAALRAAGWLAKARLATDRRGIYAACRAGLRVVEEQLGLMGSLELRAGASALGSELATTGLRAALASGRARQVLAWSDRHRSLTWRVAPVRPPADPELVADLASLRSAKDVDDTARIEQGIRRRALGVPGTPATDAMPANLADRLGARALISFAEQDGALWSTTMVDGKVHLRRSAPVGDEVERLRFAMSVALRTGRGTDAVTRSAASLDRILLSPVRRLIGDRPLVIIPCGQLRKIPWAALPSCVGRPVSVAPSATAWLGASLISAADGDPVWIAGPGLRHAEREVRTLSARFGGRALTGGAATVEQAMAEFGGASIAHVAAHGTFRADAPMFSNLRLADGPLYGYDLDRLERSPRVLILSACDVGRSAGGPTAMAIGLAAVVFRRGTAVVIASTMPVPDEQAADLMTTLHARLHTGSSPAEALAAAQEHHGHLGFSCIGAG